MIMFNNHVQNVFKGFDIFAYCQNVVQGNYINELSVIESVYNSFLNYYDFAS